MKCKHKSGHCIWTLEEHNNKECHKFVFCPYCGRRISVREPINPANWQIIRCFVTRSGMSSNEVSDPQGFEHDLKYANGETRYIIGEVHEHNPADTHVKTILEGEKDILKFILKELKS